MVCALVLKWECFLKKLFQQYKQNLFQFLFTPIVYVYRLGLEKGVKPLVRTENREGKLQILL